MICATSNVAAYFFPERDGTWSCGDDGRLLFLPTARCQRSIHGAASVFLSRVTGWVVVLLIVARAGHPHRGLRLSHIVPSWGCEDVLCGED